VGFLIETKSSHIHNVRTQEKNSWEGDDLLAKCHHLDAQYERDREDLRFWWKRKGNVVHRSDVTEATPKFSQCPESIFEQDVGSFLRPVRAFEPGRAKPVRLYRMSSTIPFLYP